MHRHPLSRRGGAGGYQLTEALHLYQAQAAGAKAGKFGLVTESGYISPAFLGGFQDATALLKANLNK